MAGISCFWRRLDGKRRETFMSSNICWMETLAIDGLHDLFIAKEKLDKYNLSLYNLGFDILTCFWWCYSWSNFTIKDRISRKRQERDKLNMLHLKPYDKMHQNVQDIEDIHIYASPWDMFLLYRFRRTHRSLRLSR